MMQYPTLRPRLNEDPKPLTGHTVAMQQQFMKNADNLHFSRTQAHGFGTSQSAGGPVLTGTKLHQENSILRMSRGIERNKIRQIPKPALEGNEAESQERRKQVIFSSYEGKSQKHP